MNIRLGLVGLVLTAYASCATPAFSSPSAIFICSDGLASPTSAGTLQRVDPNGANLTTVRTASGTDNIRGCHYDATSGLLFIVEGSNIFRISTDNVTATLMQSPTTTLSGLVVDGSNSKMYWSDIDSSGFSVASSTTALATPALLTFGIEYIVPMDIEIDTTSSKLYSANYGAGIVSGAISRVNLDGTGGEIIIPTLTTPSGIAVDHGGNRIFYTLFTANQIWTAHLDGSSPTDLTSTIGSVSAPADIDYDPSTGKIYWVEYNTDPTLGRLRRANTDGTGVENLVTSGLSRARFLTIIPDLTTIPPSLFSPASSTQYVSDLPINYALGESDTPGTVHLTFLQGSTTVASMSMMSALTVNTTIQPFTSTVGSNLTVSSASGFPIAEGAYSVRLSYQDAAGNPATSVTNSGVVLSMPTATPLPTSTATPIFTATPTETPTATPTPTCSSSVALPKVKVSKTGVTIALKTKKGRKYRVIASPMGKPPRKTQTKTLVASNTSTLLLKFTSLKKGVWKFRYTATYKGKSAASCPVQKTV